MIARLAGWGKIFFLDDDVQISTDQFAKVARSLEVNKVAGFATTNFPDNSVVRHAQRLGGKEPHVYVSGGALGVNIKEAAGFFPNIYNEDWLFMVCNRPRRANLGQTTQYAYNPFSDLRRARSEEFGDLLADGIMALASSGVPFADAGESGWATMIEQREQLIYGIGDSLIKPSQVHLGTRLCALNSLAAAVARLNTIPPQRCQEYIEAWLRDIELIHERTDILPAGLSVAEATEELRLNGAFTESRQLVS